MPPLPWTALLAALLGAAGAWGLRPSGGDGAPEPDSLLEGGPAGAGGSYSAGLPPTRSLALVVAALTAGLYGLVREIPKAKSSPEWSARSASSRVVRGCLGGAGLAYAVLFAAPFLLQSSHHIEAVAQSPVPEGAAMVQAAIDKATYLQYDRIAVSLFDTGGEVIGRQRVEAETFLEARLRLFGWQTQPAAGKVRDLVAKIPYAWSRLKFNWVKANGLIATQQCHPKSHICAFLTRSTMPFTHRVALPGAIVIRSADHVVGVFAVSGGTDAQNAAIAAHAATRAGYSELDENAGTFETSQLADL